MPEASEFRGGGAPWEAEVDTLRAAGITLVASAEVGAIPMSSSVDAKGNAHVTIPIDVAPGPRGMAPQLALEYSSTDRGGNGYLGVGFGLAGFGSVRRCGKTIDVDGAPGGVEFDADDALCLDGNRLVLAAGTYGQDGSEYRTLRDTFARIVLHGTIDEVGSWFEVFQKDGTIAEYGRGEATLYRQASGGPVLYQPYEWGLREQRDRFDNTIRYDYDAAMLTDWTFAELRPTAIAYGGSGSEQSRRHVRFVPESRDDDIAAYMRGARYGHNARLAHINVEGPDGELLFSYGLDYEGDEPDDNFLTRRSRLIEVRKCDRFGMCLPPTVIDWEVPSEGEDFLEPLTWSAWVDPSSPEFAQYVSAQVLLSTATNTLVGDFNGDLIDDVLFWSFDGGVPGIVHQVHIWDGAESMESPAADPYSTIGMSIEQLPTNVAVIDGASDPFDASHRIQASFGYAVVNATDDGLADVLVPRRAAGDGFDEHGHAYANGFSLLLGHGIGDLDFVGVDDGTSGRIYQMIPADYEGDALTDIWLCRGTGYKTATWELAHNDPPASANDPLAFSLHDTGVGCSAHDEVQLMSLRGGPPSLLVVPAYPTDPAQQLDPSDPDYTDGSNRIPEAQRTVYLELQYELGGTGQLATTDLPRDVYQRWHDQNCNNGYAAVAEQPPVWGAGSGHDKLVDVNADGLTDVLRFELAGGDTVANADIFGPGSGLPDADEEYDGGMECETNPGNDIEAITGGRIVLYVNTGEGFEAPKVVHQFAGNAHANFQLNFIGAMVHDANQDGLADLLLPSAGENGDDQWAVLVADGLGDMYDPGFSAPFNVDLDLDPSCEAPCAWPAYRDDATWMDDIAGSNASRMIFPTRSVTAPDVFFLGPYSVFMTVAPQSGFAEYRSTFSAANERVARVTDGLGAEIEFAYHFHAASGTQIFPTGEPSNARAVVYEHRTNGSGMPCEGLGHECLITTYDYGSAVVDRLGGSFLGFTRVTSQTGDRTTIAEYDYDRDTSVPGFPYASLPARTMERVLLDDGSGGQDSHLVCMSRDEWELSTTSLLGGVSYFAYPSVTSRFAAVVPGPDADCDDTLQIHRYREELQTQDLDEYGTPSSATVEITGGETTTTTWSNMVDDETLWLLGRPQSTSLQSCTSMGVCRTRTLETFYDPATGEPTLIVREPANSRLRMETHLGYDPQGHGNIAMVQLVAGSQSRTTTTTWDAEGVTPLSEENALGHVMSFLHDPATGVRYATVDPNGLTSYQEFDGMLRPVRAELRSSPTGAHDGNPITTAYEDGPAGLPSNAMRIRTSEQNGQLVLEDHDPAGRLIRREWLGMGPRGMFHPSEIPPGAAIYQTYDFDRFGRRTATSLPTWVGDVPLGHTTWDYDELDRVVSETQPDSAEDTWAYESSGLILDGADGVQIVHTDADGHKTTTYQDPQGRVVRVQEPLGAWSCWTYGAFSMVGTHTRNCDPSASGPKPLAIYGYDTIGRLTSALDPDRGTQGLTYTAFDEVDVLTDGNLDTTDFDYDGLGRLVRRTDTDGIASYVYDTVRVGEVTRSSNTNGGVSRTYAYDTFGRVRAELTAVRIAGKPYSLGYRYTYGPGGRLAQVRYPIMSTATPLEVTTQYDLAGYPRAVRDDLTAQRIWSLDLADAAGQPRQETFANGAITARSYHDLSLRPEMIRTTLGTNIQLLEYGWTLAGELDGRSDGVHGHTEDFEYDALHRLQSATVENTGGTEVLATTYDALGNVTSKTDVGPYGYDAQGELQWVGNPATTVAHDDAGQVTGRGSLSIDWTIGGRVSTLTDPAGVIEMTYAAEGDRVVRFDSDSDTYTLTLGDLFEARFDGNGDPIDWVQRVAAPTGRIIAQRRDVWDGVAWTAEYTYLHDDHLGSTSAVSDEGGDPSDVVHLAYDPWGSAREGTDWTKPYAGDLEEFGVGFTGHRAQVDKDLVYMRGRMYDPWSARFVSPDPIVAAPHSVQGHNAYSYVMNRPLAFTDPTGMCGQGISKQECDAGKSFGYDWVDDDDGGHWETPSETRSISVGGGGGPDPSTPGQVGGFWEGTGPGTGVRSDRHVMEVNSRGVGDYRIRQDAEALAASLSLRPRITVVNTCTGTCATVKPGAEAVVKPTRPLSPAQEEDIKAGQREVATESPGAAAARLTSAILAQGALSLLSKGASVAGKLCFAAGTLVHTEGGLRPIEQVSVGELVWARDEQTGEEGWKPVTRVFVTPSRELVRMVLETDRGKRFVVQATENHPFWSLRRGGWSPVIDLTPGEELFASEGGVRLVSMMHVAAETVYNLEIADWHSYFIEEQGLWVHNRCLTLADLGLAGREGVRVIGNISLKGGKATVNVEWIGNVGQALSPSVMNGLKATARAEGASVLRIQTSRIVEATGRLGPILERRWGFQSMGQGRYFLEVPL